MHVDIGLARVSLIVYIMCSKNCILCSKKSYLAADVDIGLARVSLIMYIICSKN